MLSVVRIVCRRALGTSFGQCVALQGKILVHGRRLRAHRQPLPLVTLRRNQC
jgi:hypothetical protein